MRGRRGILGVVISLFALFGLMQAFPLDIDTPPVPSDVAAPPRVAPILRRACYDCHSYETKVPWYGHVAPASWLLWRDVKEGRKALNFSRWNDLGPTQQAKKLKESWEEVQEGEMPPWYYLPLHPSARLSPGDRQVLESWFLGESSRGG